ncbi:MAG: CDP-glucose 4,6-dehydratase [Candidatus Paceibacterota bacterium]
MIQPASNVFRGRRVLITGHTGFKGSWLALWLRQLDAEVYGYALEPPTNPSNFVVSGVRDVLADHVVGDIRDASRLHAAVRDAAPELIVHLAAQPLVRRSYQVPRETFDVNVLGVATLLDTVRALDTRCAVIVATSDKCYENLETGRRYRETDRLGGRDPYSASKAAAEVIVEAYRHSFFPVDRISEHGIRLATVRAGNVIGGGDWAEGRILPDAARALSAGQALRIRSPNAVRPWQHVLDALSGYLALSAKLLTSDDPHWCDAWNFGPADEAWLTVAELIEIFHNAYGAGTCKIGCDASRLHEAKTLQLNVEKAQTELGWQPSWTAIDATIRTALWYKRFYEQVAAGPSFMRATCEQELAEYQTPATLQASS